MAGAEQHAEPITATGQQPLRIAVTGSSGLVGSRLGATLSAEGHQLISLVRRAPAAGFEEVFWNPGAGYVDTASLEGIHAVVHLAGENIASGRWTAEKKRSLRDSRVDGTRAVAESLATMKQPPRVLVSASGIHYYGDRGAQRVTEESGAGVGFLASVCQEWEAACMPAADAGIRVTHLRTGMVLAREGGALATMLTPFKLGLGGPIGRGDQYMSWIAMDDLIRCIRYVIDTGSISGPVNAVAPEPVTNREFVKTLGRVLNRPAVLPMPAFVVKLALGEMGRTLLLTSTRGYPERLLESGFCFAYPELESALRHELHSRCA